MSLAAVLYQTGQPLVVEEIHVAEPRAGEVLVRMKAAGVCHSDLHVMKGDLPMPLPIVLGHEGAGVVESVGPGVTSVAPGDSVWPIWRSSCGRCHYCQHCRKCWLHGRATEYYHYYRYINKSRCRQTHLCEYCKSNNYHPG